MGCVPSHLKHRVEFFDDGLRPPEPHLESVDEIEPVPVTTQWLAEFGVSEEFPSWIKWVHELQNWYFWKHEKSEISIV